ncbi:alpha/beta hydrolase [Cellulosimicrobium protaetiae]|uniref:Alpha/beta hydrolase n=1 Tax=Cellulosimicrobium protaetiae TaxID=2587808 RepID=A0A6M5UA95_9MICO|nr:alpha/beta hydrolase [Cellulosimicrobium protaetiae]QJW35130.1 alpha/beta hydrolase [Cellulosimicrobium protaetiae]
MADWQPDVLGDDYEQLTLPLAPDDEGEVVATLVRRRRAGGAGTVDPHAGGQYLDVLYVHGWSDYFFQTELADFWEAHGARFHALDLRKYGRSLRPGQTPGFVTDLTTYDEDLAAALAAIGHRGDGRSPRRLLLMGHSTGGLTLSLWLARNPGRASALVLNSPWLEFQTREVGRLLLEPVIGARARLTPTRPLPNVDLGFYTRSVSKDFGGEWTYDLAWRPQHGFRTTPAWLSAVFHGQQAVARGLSIGAPVLVLLSARSTLLPRWTPEMRHTDTAIDVDGVAQRSVQLGDLVTVVRLDGALHDVVLSARPVRSLAYGRIAQWVGAYLPRPAPVRPDVVAATPPGDAPPASGGLGRVLSRLGAGAHRAGRAVARTVGAAVGTVRGRRSRTR